MTGNIDKAVHAASIELSKNISAVIWMASGMANSDAAMRRAITAAIPFLPLGFEVNQLEWFKPETVHESVTYFRADTVFGKYGAWGGGRAELNDVEINSGRGSIDLAKAAAQADFERRVRECLVGKHNTSIDAEITDNVIDFLVSHELIDESDEYSLQDIMAALHDNYEPTKPVDVAAVRSQAFEEFSKAITSNDNFGFYDGISADWHPYPEYQIRKNIKDIIRALSADPAQGDHIADVGKMVEAESLKGQQHDN